MRLQEALKILCVNSEITISELARRLDKTPQALSQKMSRGTFSLKDLEEIAIVTNCNIECNFILPTEEKIKIL